MSSSDRPTWAVLSPGKLLDGKDGLKLVGRVVYDPEDPAAWFTPDQIDAELARTLRPRAIRDTDINIFLNQELASAVQARLQAILGFIGSSSDTASRQITTGTVITRYLIQYRKIFNEIKRRYGAELSEMMSTKSRLDKSLYFVVGVKTFIGAVITDSKIKESSASGDIEVPVSQIVLGATGVAVPVEVNPSSNFSRRNVGKVLIQQSAVGERVFAIQYCRIKRRIDWWAESSPRLEKGLYELDKGLGLFGSKEEPENNLYSDLSGSEEDEEDEDSGGFDEDGLTLGTWLPFEEEPSHGTRGILVAPLKD